MAVFQGFLPWKPRGPEKGPKTGRFPNVFTPNPFGRQWVINFVPLAASQRPEDLVTFGNFPPPGSDEQMFGAE
jgi:hypothetical protein